MKNDQSHQSCSVFVATHQKNKRRKSEHISVAEGEKCVHCACKGNQQHCLLTTIHRSLCSGRTPADQHTTHFGNVFIPITTTKWMPPHTSLRRRHRIANIVSNENTYAHLVNVSWSRGHCPMLQSTRSMHTAIESALELCILVCFFRLKAAFCSLFLRFVSLTLISTGCARGYLLKTQEWKKIKKHNYNNFGGYHIYFGCSARNTHSPIFPFLYSVFCFGVRYKLSHFIWVRAPHIIIITDMILVNEKSTTISDKARYDMMTGGERMQCRTWGKAKENEYFMILSLQ